MRKQKQQTLAPMPPAMAPTANDKYLFQLLPISLFDANIFHGFFFYFSPELVQNIVEFNLFMYFQQKKNP